ncbi:MAG TPA: BatD family protein [Bacteroidales bacterium]|nr:BatD family protein [Bacteroidales bacterium]
MARAFIIPLCTFLVLATSSGWSQDVKLTAQTKQVVAVGETFTLSYTLNGQGNGFRGPNIQGFNVLSGPNTSTSSSIRNINGTTTMSITYTYTYLLQATREGSFDIPAATVTVNGRQVVSNPLTVKVVKGSAPTGNQGTSGNRGGNTQQGGGGLGANDVYVKAFTSNSSPMQGEGIVVTYKIFTKVPIANINISKLSSFSGFWSQNLMKENDKLQQTTQVIDGEQYVVADIRKIALFPLKSGRLVIDPLELNCVAQVRRQTRTRTGDPFFDDFFNDSFFNTGVANVEKTLKSNPVIITARPLPEEGKPADFSGAVGNFTFRSEIDKTRLKTNEAVTLKCIVSGRGNIQLIDKMNVSFPPDFETYDPKVTSDIQTAVGGISGSQTFEYLMIPRKPGKFTIKPITFSYYDLDKKRYVTLSSPEYTLEVEKGTGESSSVMTYSGANKEDIKYIGSDIRHIKENTITLVSAGTRFFPSLAFWLLLAIPALLYLLFLVLWRKLAARRSDTVLMKNLRATKIARKRLRTAEQFRKGGKQDEFYIAISQALWGYLSDKFGIPLAELSIDSVREALVSRNVDESIIAQFMETLNNTEFCRFAPGEKTINMDRIYNEALEIITKMERELR